MDGRHFDEWARTVAAVPRRRALTMLAGGALAGALTRVGLPTQGARAGDYKNCGADGDDCNPNSKKERNGCCKGLKCEDGQCRYPGPGCGRKKDFCVHGENDCCNGFFCLDPINRCHRCRREHQGCVDNTWCCGNLKCLDTPMGRVCHTPI